MSRKNHKGKAKGSAFRMQTKWSLDLRMQMKGSIDLSLSMLSEFRGKLLKSLGACMISFVVMYFAPQGMPTEAPSLQPAPSRIFLAVAG